MTTELWTEKFRPKTLDEYVWRDPQMRTKVEEWLADGGLPHLLLSGLPGTGKTSLALLLLKLLDIPNEDLLKINASRERKIEDLQDKIIRFINTWAFNSSGLKYILLDEGDKLTPLAQDMLRNEIETYSNSCRFIFTCNRPEKINPALHSRLTEIKFSTLDNESFLLRIIDVLTSQNVSFEDSVLLPYYEKYYPDLRKCIGVLQQNTVKGVLNPVREDEDSQSDYLTKFVELFKENKFTEGRKYIIEHADPDEYDSIYRWFYQNLSLFGSTQNQQDEALLVIRKAIVYDQQVADRELNLSACLVELTRIT